MNIDFFMSIFTCETMARFYPDFLIFNGSAFWLQVRTQSGVRLFSRDRESCDQLGDHFAAELAELFETSGVVVRQFVVIETEQT